MSKPNEYQVYFVTTMNRIYELNPKFSLMEVLNCAFIRARLDGQKPPKKPQLCRTIKPESKKSR